MFCVNQKILFIQYFVTFLTWILKVNCPHSLLFLVHFCIFLNGLSSINLQKHFIKKIFFFLRES